MVTVDEVNHFVEIWLAHNSPDIEKETIEDFRRRGYRVAVFRSGSEQLATVTKSLLQLNA